jgi:pilus assembly protein Flp/PilA
MRKFFGFSKKLAKNEDGATAIEYGLLAALIAVVLIVTISALGGELSETFAGVDAQLDTANDNAAAGVLPAAD